MTRSNRIFTVYVIELDEAVWLKPKMQKRNPDRRLDKPCLYVGYSVHTPERRLEQHKNGEHAAPLVRDFGVRLWPTLYKNASTGTTRNDAEQAEAHWADHLRKKRFGVWEGRRGPVEPRRKAEAGP